MRNITAALGPKANLALAAPACRLRFALCLALFSVLLSTMFVTDPFGIDRSSRFESLLFAGRSPVWPAEVRPERGLVYSDGNIRASLEYYNDKPAFAEPGVIYQRDDLGFYYSQFALQRLIYTSLVPAQSDPATIDRYYRWFQAANAVIFGLVLGLFAAVLDREFGFVTALTAAVLIALSDWLLAFSISPFYVVGLRFLPFVLAWFLIQRAPGQRLTWTTCAALAFSVLLAALCGYDYITNVVLACAIPPLWYAWRQRRSLTTALRDAVLTVVAAMVGLGSAVAMHLTALRVHFGSLHDALAVIRDRAAERMGMSSEGAGMSANYDQFVSSVLVKIPAIGTALNSAVEDYLPALRPVLRWIRYIFMDAVTLPAVDLALPIVAFLLPVLFWRIRLPKVDGRAARELSALAGFILLGFVLSHSWAILFHEHMHHLHMNAIIFYLPFLLIAYAWVGRLVQHLFEARPAPGVRAEADRDPARGGRGAPGSLATR